ncbi:bacteriocin production protein [Desulfofustis phage LS06-2018-MD02]|jgi:hypothetical protein|nr:bacteriocin production protein [Desulfofustis phage LS06-2018-MD02]
MPDTLSELLKHIPDDIQGIGVFVVLLAYMLVMRKQERKSMDSVMLTNEEVEEKVRTATRFVEIEAQLKTLRNDVDRLEEKLRG